jgi:hypothetical protein
MATTPDVREDIGEREHLEAQFARQDAAGNAAHAAYSQGKAQDPQQDDQARFPVKIRNQRSRDKKQNRERCA